jgi:hypothetical protein
MPDDPPRLGTRWPALPLERWRDTCATLHLWTQVVGKIALAATPLVNHHWNVALQLTARGLATQPLETGDGRSLTITFDFVGHRLLMQRSDGALETFPLVPRTVADFHASVVAALERMGMRVHIWTRPCELEDAIAFEKDTVHRAYDAVWADAFWRALVSMRPVFARFRGRFIGKASPVHFFWGSFDLAATRFSGRRAVSVPDDPIGREAYSHECISHGFWPGGAGVPDAAFYAYGRPEPEGLASAIVEPETARYDDALQIFVLPYEDVRTAASPERALMTFLESTYAAAARLAQWDREFLERAP